MSALSIVKDAMSKAGFSGKESREGTEVGKKPSVSPHVAMDFIRKALDSAAPWWQTQGAAPKGGERIVNSPVEKETKPTALEAGRNMEARQREAGSRPPIGKMPKTPKGMDESLAMDEALAMDGNEMAAAATQMMSELEKHDRQHHHGQYTGGTCKLRDKVAQAAKNIGMSPKAVEKITGKKSGASGGGVSGETIPQAKPAQEESDAFKEFDALRKKIMADTRTAVQGKSEEEQKQIVEEAIGKLRSARFDYLTKELQLSPAEAGACSEIAEKVENGSEEAKKVVESLPEEQKQIVESVTGTEEEEKKESEQFADELKAQNPELAQMIDTLSSKFDGLNTALNDEQKQKFFDLQENGTDEEFFAFLESDACKFTKDQTDALKTLMDGYRSANPEQFPEYAKKRQQDELIRKVRKADTKLIADIKGGKNVDIKSRLETVGENNKDNPNKQFSPEEIADFMRAMGKSEDEITQAMQPEDDPVEKGATPEDHAKVCKANPKSNCPFLKAHMTPERLAELDKPTAAQKIADIAKGTEISKHVNDLVRRLDDNSKEAKDVFWDLKENLGDQISDDDIKALLKENGYSDDQILAGEMGVTMPPKELTPEEKRQKELDDAFNAAKEAYEKAAGDDKGKAWEALKKARQEAEGFKKNPVIEEPGQTQKEEGEVSESPDTNAAPPPLPIPPDPLPDYNPPNVEGWAVPQDAQNALGALNTGYENAQTPEQRQQFKDAYENYMAELDQQAAMAQAANDLEKDDIAQAEEEKHPGFIKNMKDFFGGLAKSIKGDHVMKNVPAEAREQLGLPAKGDIRESEYRAALARKAREDSMKRQEEKAAEESNSNAVSVKGGYSGNTPTTDIYDPIPKDVGDTAFEDNLRKKLESQFGSKGIKAKIVAQKNGPSVVEYEVKRDPSLSEADLKKKLEEISSDLGGELIYEPGKSRGEFKEYTGYIRATNPKPHDSYVSALLDKPGSVETAKGMSVPFLVGETTDGDAFWVDLKRHGFMGGDSGMGKSARVRGGLSGMLHTKTPNEVQVLVNAHANAGDYANMEGDPHVRGIADSVEKVKNNLQEANKEWKNRLALFNKENVKDIDEYNEKMRANGKPEEQLPYLLTITEEVTNLLQEDPSLEDEIRKIVTNGRKFGVCHLGITQDMNANNMGTDIKGDVRMGLRSPKEAAAKQIFGGSPSPEEKRELASLEAEGGILVRGKNGHLQRLRGAFIPKNDIDHLREYNASTYQKTGENSTQSISVPSNFKPTSPTHVSNMPDGMEVHKSPDNKIFFKRNGRQYKPARGMDKNGNPVTGWVLADGSDKRIFTFNAPQKTATT